jgi:hypothetical protein
MHMGRRPPHRLPSNIGKVRAVNFVSVNDVSRGDRAIFDEIRAYQTLKFAFGGGTNHPHKASRRRRGLDLLFSKALIVVTNGADGWRGEDVVSIIDKDYGSVGMLTKINSVETAGSRREFDNAHRSVNLEDAATVSAVISDPELLTQLIKRKNVRNAPRVEVDRGITEISLEGGIESAFVAVDVDGA